MSNDWIHEAYCRHNDFNIIFAEWRTFDRDHAEYIRSTIGLILFGIQEDVENPPPTVSYYQVYSAEKQKIIDTIYGHILQKCNSPDEIFLSCTYLIVKGENEEIFPFPVLRYSQSLSSQIYFTEVSGRYYESWDDLISSIPLPPCDFIAPSDGLYKSSTPVYMQYKSPAASTSQRMKNTANTVLAVSTVGLAVASLSGVAPVIVATLGIGSSVFGVGQSISTLLDRSSHGQSIALDNRESLFSYGNIVATSLTGVSSAAVSNLGRLQRFFGNYASAVTTTCKVLNISTVVFDSGFLLINAYDFAVKLKTRTVTYQDVFDLSLQIFLVCGAVIQTRDMHRLLQQSQSPLSGTVNKKLTRTQKRNLQKRRARARTRGDSLIVSTASSESANTVAVRENDVYASLKTFSLRVGGFGVHLMMSMYPRSEVVLNYYYDVKDLIRDTFVDGTMEVKQFLQQIFYHSRNLYALIREDIARIQEILRLFIPDPIISNNEVIAQTVNNEVDRINQAAEEFMPSLDTTERQDEETILTVDTNDTRRLILKFVYETCSKYKTTHTADAQISLFHSILIFTTNYVDEKSVYLFNETFNRSKKVVGEDKARKMASLLGTKTDKDFYPTIACVRQVLQDCATALRNGMNNIIREPCDDAIGCSMVQQIFEQYFQLMNTMYEQVNSQNEIGIRRMMSILREISSALENKLGGNCRKIAFESRSLYEEHIGILGKEIVEEMLASIEMPTTELEIFQSALRLLKVEDITEELKPRYDWSEELIQAPSSAYLDGEKSNEEIIAKLITAVFEKIKESKSAPHFASKEDMFIATTYFVAEKLITKLKMDSKLYGELKKNTDLVGPELLKVMLEAIGMYASEKSYLFKTKTQLLGSENSLENMVAEFSNRYHNAQIYLQLPKIFGTTISDDGFITYKIICDQNGSSKSYTELVELLFKIKIDESDCRIERDKRCVVVKSKNKVITFTFTDEENTALVILTDLGCSDEQTESLN